MRGRRERVSPQSIQDYRANNQKPGTQNCNAT